jgi:Domain of unknown function (DUF397)
MERKGTWSEAHWFKSSHSGDGNCVEVAFGDKAVGVRDSKRPAEAILEFTDIEWSAFTQGVRDGSFDR